MRRVHMSVLATCFTALTLACTEPAAGPTTAAPVTPVFHLTADPDIVLSDGIFSFLDWYWPTFRVVTRGGGSAQTGTYPAPDYHPTGVESIHHRHAAASPEAPNDILVFGSYGEFNPARPGLFSPVTQGRIAAIDYLEMHQLHNCGIVTCNLSLGPALLQNGHLYVASVAVLTTWISGFGHWSPVARTGLTAADFTLAADASAPLVYAPDASRHPDFSQSGAPIQFGNFRYSRNDQPLPAGPGSGFVSSQSDYWEVTIHREITNRPPVANAGPDQTVECNGLGGTAVTLGGTGSSDLDGDALTYSWQRAGAQVAAGAAPTITLGLGSHTLTLVVTDPSGASASDDVTITVRDTQAPAITLTLTTATLGAPNHLMQLVVDNGISATDACDAAPTVTVSVTSNEPVNGLGDGDTEPDWEIIRTAYGFRVWVRAERSGTGNGRVYTITVTATDHSGNTATQSAAVTVAGRGRS